MADCVYICDNVTTCDNLFLVGCHVVSRCFLGVCDNVTTSAARPHIQAHAHAPDTNIYIMMSHCHINKLINSLQRDNLLKSVVTGCHCDNGNGVDVCGGGLLMLTIWFPALVIRLVSQALVSVCSIQRGHQGIHQWMATLTGGKRVCWGFVKQKMMRLRCAMAMLGLIDFYNDTKKDASMSSDFDWLEYLSLLTPKGCFASGAGGGNPTVTREDVLAALSGVSGVASLLIDARIGVISSDALAERSHGSAFISALVMFESVMRRYSPNDFLLVWREMCRDDVAGNTACPHCHHGFIGTNVCATCSGTGFTGRSSANYASSAGVSRTKWVGLSGLIQPARSVIACRWDDVRCALHNGLGRGYKIPTAFPTIDRASNLYIANATY